MKQEATKKNNSAHNCGYLNSLFHIGRLDDHFAEFEIVPDVQDVDAKNGVRKWIAKVIAFLFQREMNNPNFLNIKVLTILASPSTNKSS